MHITTLVIRPVNGESTQNTSDLRGHILGPTDWTLNAQQHEGWRPCDETTDCKRHILVR